MIISKAMRMIERELQDLCERLSKSSLLYSIIMSSHFAVVLQATSSHVISSKQKGWTLPTLVDIPNNEVGIPDACNTSTNTIGLDETNARNARLISLLDE